MKKTLHKYRITGDSFIAPQNYISSAATIEIGQLDAILLYKVGERQENFHVTYVESKEFDELNDLGEIWEWSTDSSKKWEVVSETPNIIVEALR